MAVGAVVEVSGDCADMAARWFWVVGGTVVTCVVVVRKAVGAGRRVANLAWLHGGFPTKVARWVVGASIVVWVEVAGTKETPGAGELRRLGAKVAGWVCCSFVGAEGALVRCLDVELTALNVAERAKLVERLCAVGAFRWSAVGSRAGGGSGGGVVIVM